MADGLKTRRHYYKCPFCLNVFAVDGDPIHHNKTPRCGLCKWDATYMGQVSVDGKHLEKEEHECPCDERCTHAAGPNCTCECHSANHGQGVAAWTVVTITDEVPILTCSDPEVLKRHTIISHELQEVYDRIQGIIGAKDPNSLLIGSKWKVELRNCIGTKVQKLRLDRLKQLETLLAMEAE